MSLPAHERAHAVFPLIRLRPEQVAGAVIQAARIKKTDRDSSLFLQLQTLTGTNDFVKQYGDVGEDEFTTDSVTITQRLLMMNGNMLGDIVNSNPVLNTSAHVAMFAQGRPLGGRDGLSLCLEPLSVGVGKGTLRAPTQRSERSR